MRRHSTIGLLLTLLIVVGNIFYTAYGAHQTLPVATPAAVGAAQGSSTTTPDTYRVIRVVDGDTVDLDMQGKNVTIRLIGVNTPEVVKPRAPVECYGPEASAEAHRLLDQQWVRLEVDPTQGTFDKYGRTLGYLFLLDGTNFDEHQIAAGFGREYTYKQPYKYQKEFKAAEVAAKARGLGLWSACI